MGNKLLFGGMVVGMAVAMVAASGEKKTQMRTTGKLLQAITEDGEAGATNKFD